MGGTIWCLHGAVGMADDWRGFSVPGWAVKRVDLWRFLDCCPMAMEAFGRALNEEAEAVPGRKVLLGYSMGGRLALHALLEGRDERPRSSAEERSAEGVRPYPWDGQEGRDERPRSSAEERSAEGVRPYPWDEERSAGGVRPYPWDAAVIVSSHPGLESEEERAGRRARDAEWATMALSGDWAGFLDAWHGQEVLGTSKVELRTSNIEAKMADRGGLEMRRSAVGRSFMDWSLGGQEALWGKLSGLNCPALWVAGERDGKFRSLAERASKLAGECWIAPGAGHRVPWESPDFAARVGEFLERVVS